ncbi:sensor histidine kinase [Phaeobacter gallaeciensis]|uniref:sensor histidine kinase n=1 Tax=Phaeobacter gallaeciensis TaxID=60890 RepID=UPI00237FCFFE|nr:hybrid sensor histidine kinase/response regulator [Phaeobacter gallaeciensis]MDE4191805.1 ATP-binding protein [Phaeobacter gallaeciensis]MDE4200268.1 ATP-binding protein [Phaeobacter gallaeciensis]MDE4204284.1 ATP-binding protein [Phaeobacter gallaeciensis]MDE4208560.1 ATP-binding protein [Phaeobacter gallaeciensis]MDE4216793.1 ATP-binding protein [Phaeobacter gallaeciensis]
MLDIMIVDDDEGDRKLVRRLLRAPAGKRSFREASNGQAALDYTDDNIDVIFLDYLLPGMSGLELLEHFSKTWPKATIFLMTGQGDEEIAKSAILQGASDYIPKSIMTETALNRMIENGIKLSKMRWKLEEHRQELSLFSDVLVHDLRAPVRAIEFLSEQIIEDFESGNMDEVAREFEMMKLSVRRMSELIESLASHINLNGPSNQEKVSVENLFERAQMALAKDISESGAEVRWKANGLSVDCIAPQVAQLLQNLIGNSIKYAGPSSPVISVSAAEIPNGIQFTVADNGVGVPEDFRDKIFEPFRRLQQTEELPGTGLGLATCRKIAERHDGEIWCAADTDVGTTIHFTIKQRPEEEDN